MELMDIRRMLMTIGVKGMIGEFSKYQKIKITPDDMRWLEVDHALGETPKLVIVSSEQTYVSSQFMLDGVFSQNCGCMRFLSGAGTTNGYYYPVEYSIPASPPTQKAYMTDTKVLICRGASTRSFDTNTEYTVELYA